MTISDLTERQEAVYKFLKAFLNEHGYPPTMREIGEKFGFSWPAARNYLAILQKKGLIRLDRNKSRGMEIPELRRPDVIEVPVAGRIRAGKPITAVEDIETRIALDRDLFRAQDAFALTVTGESMIDAGIFDGDYVIVNPQPELNEGEIGVFLLGDEATVKKVSFGPETITLMPANVSLSPITYPAADVQIVGRVVGVIRKY